MAGEGQGFNVSCSEEIKKITKRPLIGECPAFPFLIKTAVETLTTIGLDPKHVGGKPGILAVLHTWTRALERHPPVHMLVPAGGVDKDGNWKAFRKKFLVPVQALSRGFRYRFMKQAQKAL